jgi:hypothetical protein
MPEEARAAAAAALPGCLMEAPICHKGPA